MGKIWNLIDKGLKESKAKQKKRSRYGRVCMSCGHLNEHSRKGLMCENCGDTLE